jgi:hypothetical protein
MRTVTSTGLVTLLALHFAVPTAVAIYSAVRLKRQKRLQYFTHTLVLFVPILAATLTMAVVPTPMPFWFLWPWPLWLVATALLKRSIQRTGILNWTDVLFGTVLGTIAMLGMLVLQIGYMSGWTFRLS